MRLRPYKSCDAEKIVTWLTDERMMHRWCATEFSSFPLTADALNDYYDARKNNENYFAMTAFDENAPIGHFIFEFKDEKKTELWLGFVVLAPEMRGKGLAKELVKSALQFGFQMAGAEKITLAVFKENLPALRTYRALGFRELPHEGKPLTILGEPWEAYFMELCRKETEY